MFPIKKIRTDFPILQRSVNGKPLVYFDNAATSQTPKVVIDAIVAYYTKHNANIHRGVHTLSQEATDLYEEARIKACFGVDCMNIFFSIFSNSEFSIISRTCHRDIGQI